MARSLHYIALLLLLGFSPATFSQSSLSFSESGLKAALDKAKTEHKPVLLWCYTTWCPHCKTMKANVFTSPAVADYFNKTFVCVSQDTEKGQGVELNKELKISSFPTFIFYDSDGKTIYRVEGELKSAAFIKEGKNALNPKRQLPYLKQQFEKDVSNSTNCYEYLRALKKGGLDFSTIVKQYFATQSDNQLLSEVNWRIITNGITDIHSRELKFVISHQKEFSSIASPERVKRKLDYVVKELLNPLAVTTDTLNYLINRILAVQIRTYSTDSMIFNFDLRISALTKNWNAYRETCQQSTKAFAWNNHTQLNEIAGNFLNNITDSKALMLAELWAQRSLALDEEYDTYLLCARLYKKLNNTKDAIKMATKGRDLAAKYGWEGVEAENLLKELNRINK